MPIAGTIEHDDAVLPGRQVNKPAGNEVLDHTAVAMKQNQWQSLATLQVMKADPVCVDEPPNRGIAPLRPLCKLVVGHGRGRQNAGDGKSQPPPWRSLIGAVTFASCKGFGEGWTVQPFPPAGARGATGL